jgi:molybdate transport system substrate-binding protein
MSKNGFQIMRRFSSLRLLAVVAVVVAVPGVALADDATLAAGAGFRRPLSELASAYEKAKGHKISQVYGHMGQVIAQTKESGKIAVVCGDRAVLDAAKGVSFSDFARLGLGKLVVVYRKGLTLAKPEDIVRADIKRIGIPDQTNAIYGKAGRQFLERANLAAQVDPKLMAVATVPQVTSYVISGEVDAGFVNATDAIGAAGNVGGFLEVDPKLYDPVEVACGIVASGAKGPAVAGFIAFLATDEARAILARYGL